MDDEHIKDLAVSLRPRGIAAHEIPAFVDMIISIVRIEAMKWRFDPATGQWVNPDNGTVDTRPSRNGCKEIAEQGYMHANAVGVARPKPGDLKPSDSLLRSLNNTALDAQKAKRAEMRRHLEELDRQIERGQLVVDDDALKASHTVEVDQGNGRRLIIPSEKATPSDFMAAERAREETLAKLYAEKAIEPNHAPPDDVQEVGGFRHAIVNGHDPALPKPAPQRDLDFKKFTSWDSPIPAMRNPVA